MVLSSHLNSVEGIYVVESSILNYVWNSDYIKYRSGSPIGDPAVTDHGYSSPIPITMAR